MKLCSLIVFSLAIPLSILADIAGTYEVEGTDPATGPYTGIATIQRIGIGIYTAKWTFSDGSTDVGTGVKQVHNVSFVFKESSGDFGTQLYEILNNLEGKWIRFGATKNGGEKLRKIKEHHHSHSH